MNSSVMKCEQGPLFSSRGVIALIASVTGNVMVNSVDLIQMLHSSMTDLGLHVFAKVLL